MPQEFASADEATSFVAQHLAAELGDIVPSPILFAISAADLLPISLKSAETVRPPGARPAHVAALNWVIRDEDLKLLDTILESLKASAAAGFFAFANIPVTASMVAAAGIFTGLLKLLYNAVGKGVYLTDRDYFIISVLIGQQDGMTEEELLDRLLKAQHDWTMDAVRSGLAGLSNASSRSGKIALVWKSHDNRWRTAGV